MAGRLVCDTYMAAKENLRETTYTLTELARTQLGKRRAEVDFKQVLCLFVCVHVCWLESFCMCACMYVYMKHVNVLGQSCPVHFQADICACDAQIHAYIQVLLYSKSADILNHIEHIYTCIHAYIHTGPNVLLQVCGHP
jgi:hypothetical protein